MSDVTIQYQNEFKRVPGFVFKPEDLCASAMLINLCKDAAAVLTRHYAGWRWEIRPDEHGGIVDFFSLMLNARYGYTLHIPTMQKDTRLDCVRNAGGEILERFGFRRVPYSYAEWRRRVKVHGEFIPDVSDLPLGVRRTMHAAHVREAVRTGHAKICMDPRIGLALAAHKAGLLHGE